MDVRFVKIENSWTVSFKQRRNGTLVNIVACASNMSEACRKAAAVVKTRYPNKDYREYGVSQTTEMQESSGWFRRPDGKLYRHWTRWGLIVATEEVNV